MAQSEEIKQLLHKLRFTFSNQFTLVCKALVVFGILLFCGSWFLKPTDAWQALLINCLFFGGISVGGLMFSVISTVTDSFWFRPMKRFGEAMAVFSLVCVVGFVLLFFSFHQLYVWADPNLLNPAKAAWLNIPSFILRHLLGYAFFAFLAFIYLKNSIVPDLRLAEKFQAGYDGSVFKSWLKKAEDIEKEKESAYKKNKYLAPWLGFTGGLILSFLAFDWMMSADQNWFSTMFGVQYVISSLIGAGAFLIVLSSFVQSKWQLGEYQTIFRHHDLSKLTFAFTLLWTYMVFSQVLVIWYANMPEETPFMILRMKSVEWGWFFWVLFFVLFIFPFFGLMSRTACRSPLFSSLVAIDLLLGLWLEKYFLIVPSMQENQILMHPEAGLHLSAPGWSTFFTSFGLGLGFLSLFLLLFFRFLNKVPALPISDNRLFKQDLH